MSSEEIRSFIAIDLPEEVKTELTSLQAGLKSGSRASVRWVNPGSIHLTLKFLGNIDSGLTDSIVSAMEEAVSSVHSFRIKVKGLGAFPNLRKVNIIWVGLEGDIKRLQLLQSRIDSVLVPFGFKPESRPFTPHLTLARLRDYVTPDERLKLGQLIAETTFESDFSLYINAVNLMKSQLTREGPIYSRIGSVKLK